MKFEIQKNTTSPGDGYPDRLGPSGEFVEKSKKKVPGNYQLSDQIQCSVMASRTSDQACSKGLDAGTYCK